MQRPVIMVTIFIFTLSPFITSCGHMVNPAPPKVELTSTKDQSCSCEEMNTEILGLQTKRVDTQKLLDNQTAQNVLSGIGGWLIIVPFVFIDATTDKNASYNSYANLSIRCSCASRRAYDKGTVNIRIVHKGGQMA